MSAADETRQLVEMPDHIAYRPRPAQHAAAIPQDEQRGLLWVALFLFDHEERRFMGVPEDREQGHAVHVIKRVVPPFTGRDARAVSRQDQAEFGP